MSAWYSWKEVDHDRYWEMLEILPPAAQSGLGFLVGEPVRHDEANQPMFWAFVEIQGRFFESEEPITITAFKWLSFSPGKAQTPSPTADGEQPCPPPSKPS